VNPPPDNPLTNGWVVVDDAYRKGGYNDLKVFICPEIHQNAIDIRAMIAYSGIRIPRISQLCNQGFQDQAGFDYGMNGGLPTTYLANAVFFGLRGNVNSYRADQISGYSQKALVIEGGHAMIDGGGGDPYYDANWSWYYGVDDGSDLSSTSRLYTNSIQKTSYVHDNYDKFWVMNSQPWAYYFPSFWGGRNFGMEIATKFNSQFEGKAYMVSGCQTSSGFFGFSIVSFVDPDNGAIFKNFFKANNPGVALAAFKPFIDEPNEYQYLTGNMNVLFGDGSVITKDQAWLCNNRRRIALNIKE
jgi:prepilin-type processing-associated H-X9-DG protein